MNFKDKIFNIKSSKEFETLAIQIFNFQYKKVPVYTQFCDLLATNPKTVKQVKDIPFLPIQFFKTQKVLEKNGIAEKVFNSSGTTGIQKSKHYVTNLNLYKNSFLTGFSYFFGNLSNYNILALLPSYLEQKNSSLVFMVDELIKKSNSHHSNFYLNNFDELIEKIQYLENNKKKTILFGVSYALLDLIEKQTFNLKNTLVLETGGMKGRRKEQIKSELHEHLKKGFGVNTIYSEYGMTELLSQAYSKGNGIFTCPSWMKILTRDTEDAFSYVNNTTGGINIIDLANLHSCSFIATQDLGKVAVNGSFEILGRFDNSDIRGCNLMVE
ncbi:MAG: LuxE/PaaK family acyltransferase [Flavobacteriales bacterium]